MNGRLREAFPYLLVLAVNFYLLPALIRDTGTAMLLMLVIMPMVAFFTGVMGGVCLGVCLWLPFAAVLLFLPTLFIYYNSSASVYVLVYGGLVLLGNLIGRIFYGKR